MHSRNCWLTTGTPCSWERWIPSISHMRAVVRYLARHDYRARSAEWLTVFGY
jgi:hypothetical protein